MRWRQGRKPRTAMMSAYDTLIVVVSEVLPSAGHNTARSRWLPLNSMPQTCMPKGATKRRDGHASTPMNEMTWPAEV
eukprot:CAMPEP_0177289052 /NCGR_PEP_ID=MMETSP0367-20130122/74998_1 /TAXON_ID=447022 ORGANISM="Scrippsiella hangoei-like, Strain SHHI-4" /NCGR_SAMPLE_ID=MMETSP0367 /ASSEMBLY_ACC=CAM_ASM_000362 /LENGTH=76 /DNA_ID=CAMNT_0018746435 /DNA_START=12 /DNA_END=242 /DNA_ORIENTATION=+